MATRDLQHNILPVQALAAQSALAVDTDTAGVDLQGFESAVFVVNQGAVVDAGFAAALEESDDNAAFTAVAASETLGAIVATASSSQSIGYIGSKRYVRLALTVPGATDVGVTAILSCAHDAPAQ